MKLRSGQSILLCKMCSIVIAILYISNYMSEYKAGFHNLFDPRPPLLDSEDSATPRTNLYHDHFEDYFEIWLIISGIFSRNII